ncbi:MAG: glycosyl transferase [Betaproteobacteria bacterium]|nr:glycosyl transferase [Betaproteobacteria bacterium]
MSRRILFAIRSKLGDTLISYAAVRAYVDAHPQDRVTLLTRTDYARLFAGEAGVRVIGFDSRVEMFLRLLWLRMSEAAFDVLGLLWGSGPPVAAIGRWVRAHRKIAWNRKFAPEIFEEGRLAADPLLVEPAMSVIHAFAPETPMPTVLSIRSLAERYAAGTASRVPAIGIVPIADELRRNFDAPTLLILLGDVRKRHPEAKLRVYANPRNTGAPELMRTPLPPGCEWCSFRDLRDLLEQYMELTAWYGTDTGLYHLAAAIGIPATVFFGPTQPHKIVMPAQPAATWARLAELGDSHCEQKSCTRPCCLHQAVADFCGVAGPTPLEQTPGDCPLRAFPAAALQQLRIHRPA